MMRRTSAVVLALGAAALVAACERKEGQGGSGPQDAVSQAQKASEQALREAREAQSKASEQQQKAQKARDRAQREGQEAEKARAEAESEFQQAQQLQSEAQARAQQAQQQVQQNQQQAVQAQAQLQQEQQQRRQAQLEREQAALQGQGQGGGGQGGQKLLVGTVARAGAKEVTVRPGNGQGGALTLAVDGQTEILVDGQRASAEQLSAEQHVNVTWQQAPGMPGPRAVRIDAQTATGGSGAQP
jgi:colicin import membrane protein